MSTEGVTLSGRPHRHRLKTDGILENSVLDTDAEGAKGYTRPNLSGERTESFTTIRIVGLATVFWGVFSVRSL